MFKYMLSVLILVTLTSGCSWTHNQAMLNTETAREDVEYWIDTVNQVHPSSEIAIWRETSLAKAEKWVADKDKISRQELGLFLNALNHSLHDGHTQVNALADYWRSRLSGGPGFPLTIRYYGDQFIINQTTVGLEHLRGKSLDSINGIAASSIIEKYVPFVTGETKTTLYNRVGLQLPAYLEDCFPLQNEYQVVVDGEPLTLASQKLNWSQSTDGEYQLFIDDDIAYIRLPSFFVEIEVVKQAVEKIKSNTNINKIVIDLRNNGGGNANIGFYLLQQLTSRKMVLGSKQWRYSDTYQTLVLSHNIRNKQLPPWLGLQHILSLDWFINAPNTVGEWSHEQSVELPGICLGCNYQLFLVIDETVASAAIDLASVVKDNQLGQILGRKTAGPASYYSEVAYVLLPNSGLSGQVSSAIWTRPNGQRFDGGVKPDIEIGAAWSEQEWRQNIIRLVR